MTINLTKWVRWWSRGSPRNIGDKGIIDGLVVNGLAAGWRFARLVRQSGGVSITQWQMI